MIRLAPVVEESADDVDALADAVNERKSMNPSTSEFDRPVVAARREPGSRKPAQVLDADAVAQDAGLPPAESAVSETRGHLRILQPPARRNPRG